RCAAAAQVPTAGVYRSPDVLGAIAETQAKLDGQRSAMLVLQDRVARELSRCAESLAEVAQAPQTPVRRLCRRAGPADLARPALGGRQCGGGRRCPGTPGRRGAAIRP